MNEYQLEAGETDLQDGNLICHVLGLGSEAGEVAGKVKKVIRDNGNVWGEDTRLAAALELGGVLWYVARIASDLGFTLQEIADMNLRQLASRKERGVIGGSGDNR